MKSNITTIGGGTGTFNVLSGLGRNRQLNLAAIVSVADSGGSTGELRDEFGILPPGDVRRAIVEELPSHALRQLAVSKGMTTLRQAGIRKILAGITSVEEMMSETMQ